MITESVASYYFRTSLRWVDETFDTQYRNAPNFGQVLKTSSYEQEELVCIKKSAFSSFIVPRVVSEKK